jgi:3-dehydroquinate synthase
VIELQVELGARAYPISIGEGLINDEALLRRTTNSSQVMIVTNEIVAPLYLDPVERAFSGRKLAHVILPDGEQHKTLASFEQIISALLEHGFDRGCSLVALGGGVVGDITGFAAASYQRGVACVQIPTTLLAQVDSSVGGKTAVNHPLGKNMIGAFHQPAHVIADTSSLATLDARELKAGVAEVIKYGLLGDAPFFDWLEEHLEDLLALNEDAVTYAVRRSCENKAAIVARDELESGVRALLNLGHTFGHGIENVYGYGNWLHGEAVACGMCMAAELSVGMGLLDVGEYHRITNLVRRAGLPVAPPPDVNGDALHQAMRVDKKNRDGLIRLVLLRSIGEAFLTDDYPAAEFQRVVRSSGSG